MENILYNIINIYNIEHTVSKSGYFLLFFSKSLCFSLIISCVTELAFCGFKCARSYKKGDNLKQIFVI